MIDATGELLTVDAVAVAQQVSWCGIPGERFDNLLTCPLRRRRVGHVEMDDPSPVMGQDDEDEQHLERHRGNGEEINRDQVSNVVIEKRLTALRWWLAMTGHVLGDCRVRDLDPEFE